MRFLLLFIFFNIYQLKSQNLPAIKDSRPRINIDSARMAYLRQNYTTGDCGNTYNSFLNAVNNNWYNDPQLYMLGDDPALWTWDFNSPWWHDQGQFVATLYKINNDEVALLRVLFLIKSINEYCENVDFASMDFYTAETNIRAFADVGVMLLDWYYDDMDEQTRKRLALNLYNTAEFFMDNYILNDNGTSYVTGHNIWNVYYANQFALALHGSDGLNSEQLGTVDEWYTVSYDKAVNEILPVAAYYRDDDGGWNWTAAYSIWSLIDEFQFFENMRIATGKNFYEELPWIKNTINQYYYFIQPDGWTINWGDGFTNLQGDRAIYRHAAIYKDPRSLWLAQHWSKPENISWTRPLFQKLLYKDFDASEINFPVIETDWFSDKTGLSVSRTDWTDTATMVWTYNAPTKKAGHEHRDNNSFNIFKHTPQIINGGYYDAYGTEHYVNYYMRTIAHNSICVFDSSETYNNWGVNVSNDGGQIESPTLQNYNDIFSSAAQKGSWQQWSSGPEYNYTISDAHQSYDIEKLDRFRRRILFLKPSNVIVLDHLHLLNTNSRQRDAAFMLHFQQKPKINGNMTEAAVPGHVESFSGSDIFQQNRDGNVAIRTILPENSITKRIGGSGYEYYVDGINYPVQGNIDTVNTTPGNWRIEVHPAEVQDSLIFLHTINIGDKDRPAQAGGKGSKNAHSIYIDWKDKLYFFKADGLTDSEYHRADQIPGGRALEIVAADLIPLQQYHILVDDNKYLTLDSDENGIIKKSINLVTGDHKIEITSKDIQLKQIELLSEKILIYPNPGNGLFHLNISDDPSINIEITDSFGKRIIKSQNSRLIDLRNFPNGIYYVRINSGDKVFINKIIKQ